jgi:hypothetical protein
MLFISSSIFITLIIAVILLFLYKTKSPFWKYQPVYHLYNPYNYFHFIPRIINEEPIEKNKYYNKDIKCIDTNNLSNNEKQLMTNLIQNHFLNDKKVHYNPNLNEIFTYFNSHNKSSYVSLHYTNEKFIEEKKQIIGEDEKLIGCISSRPLEINFFKKHNGSLNIYYVDHLCVDSKYRNQKIAPQLIQSHERYRRLLKPKMRISLFRRDISLSNIMPFTIFNCYVFDCSQWYIQEMQDNLYIEEINSANFSLFYNYFQQQKENFECIITPSISHISELIKDKMIHIYVAQVNNELLGIYFFRNSSTYFYNQKAGECFGSIHNKKFNKKDFIAGFQNSTYKCLKKYNYYHMLYDDISHNKAYIDHLIRNQNAHYNYKCGYYFYNYLIHPKPSHEVFMFH